MKILNILISSLIPYEFNNRNHDQQQVDRIANSIKEFGFNQPLVIDESNIILVGHGRLAAAQKLGLKEVPVLKVENLSEVQKKAYRILDNKLQNDSTWSFNNLELELGFLEDEGFDLPSWGLDELSDMINPPAANVKEDGFEPTEQKETYIKLGDLIELGEHRVLCGDSANQIAELLEGKKPCIVFADPPYGVSIGKKNKFLNEFDKHDGNLLDIQDDDLSPEELKAKLLPTFSSIKLLMAEDCTLFVTAPQGGELGMMMMMMQESGLRPRHVLIWKKNAPTFSMGRLDYDYAHEPILLTWGRKHKRPMQGNHKTSVWEIDKPRSNKEHPTMKPVELVANALLNNSDKGDICLDPYLGSGTSLIASEQTGRICYGTEIEPHYCQVIIDRYKAHCEKVNKPFVCKINGELFNPDI